MDAQGKKLGEIRRVQRVFHMCDRVHVFACVCMYVCMYVCVCVSAYYKERTVAFLVDRRMFCIFMASTMQISWPASTCTAADEQAVQ